MALLSLVVTCILQVYRDGSMITCILQVSRSCEVMERDE
jgi:hypothetical protein